jgi:hypothetical protein
MVAVDDARNERSGGAMAMNGADPGDLDEALRRSPPGDDLHEAARQGTISAGERGPAADVDMRAGDTTQVAVVIGKIPDADDPSELRWSARCSDPEHDLLGHYGSEAAALDARNQHLALHD